MDRVKSVGGLVTLDGAPPAATETPEVAALVVRADPNYLSLTVRVFAVLAFVGTVVDPRPQSFVIGTRRPTSPEQLRQTVLQLRSRNDSCWQRLAEELAKSDVATSPEALQDLPFDLVLIRQVGEAIVAAD